MKKIILGAVAAMLLVAPAADAKAFRGTVVKKGTRSVVVATKTGTLKTVKTSRHLKLGTQLRVSGKSVKVVGHATRAHISGVVRGNTAISRRAVEQPHHRLREAAPPPWRR